MGNVISGIAFDVFKLRYSILSQDNLSAYNNSWIEFIHIETYKWSIAVDSFDLTYNKAQMPR